MQTDKRTAEEIEAPDADFTDDLKSTPEQYTPRPKGKFFPEIPSSRKELRKAIQEGLTEEEFMERIFVFHSCGNNPAREKRPDFLPEIFIRKEAVAPLASLLKEAEKTAPGRRPKQKEPNKPGTVKIPDAPVAELEAPIIKPPIIDPRIGPLNPGAPTLPGDALNVSPNPAIPAPIAPQGTPEPQVERTSALFTATAFSTGRLENLVSIVTDFDSVEAFNLGMNIYREEKFNEMVQNTPDEPRIFAEGDSQFLFPLSDVVKFIRNEGIPIRSIADAGSEAERLATPERLADVRNIVRAGGFHTAILSTGGNDLLGSRFKSLLRVPTDPLETSNPLQFLKTDEFETFLSEELAVWIRQIIGNIVSGAAEAGQEINIIVHCYYRLYPGAGLFDYADLKNTFFEIGIFHPTTQQAIIDHVVRRANEVYRDIAEEFPTCRYLDNQSLLNPFYFPLDEIHPFYFGYERVASAFLQAAQWPS